MEKAGLRNVLTYVSEGTHLIPLALIVLQTLFRFISSIKEPRSYRKVWPAWLIVLEEVRWTLEFPLLGRPQRPQGHARRPWTTKGMARNSAAILMPMTMLRPPEQQCKEEFGSGTLLPTAEILSRSPQLSKSD